MVIVYLLVGFLAGMISFALALLLGAAPWLAVLSYCFGGALGVAVAGMAFAARNGRMRADADDLPMIVGLESVGASGSLADSPAPANEKAVDAAGMRILAVDDDPFILELIPKIAATAGFPTVATAPSAMAALDMIAAADQPFDCLLLDINMPEIDGIALCGRLRKCAAYRETPIIMLTAMTDLDHMNAAFRAGASDYTTKPFDIIDFGERLRIAHARLAAQNSRQVREIMVAEKLAPLSDVPALIGPRALASYVSRLSGSALTGAYVMAVTMDQPPSRAAHGSVLTLLPNLVRIARAIDDVFCLSPYVMAHAGQGQFLIVANGSVLPDAQAVRAEIAAHLEQGMDGIDDLQFNVVVGQAIRLQAAKADRARIAFESAIILAERAADVAANRFETSGKSATGGR